MAEPHLPKARALRTVTRLGLAAIAVLVLGLAAGWLFARSNPQAAAGALVADYVVDEPFVGDERRPAATDDPAPTSGNHVGSAWCGERSDPVGVDDQLASLAAGVVVIQYRPDDLAADDREVLAGLAGRDRVLVAPNPDLGEPVVATAWTRRLPLPDANQELLRAFVTAFAGGGPRGAEGCPDG